MDDLQQRMAVRRRRMAEIPAQYAEMRLKDYDPDRGNRSAYETVCSYVESLDDHLADGRGLVFVGGPGRGKTLLSTIVLNEALDRGHSAHFATLAGLIRKKQDYIKSEKAWDRTQDESALEKVRHYHRVFDLVEGGFRFLTLDDVGKEHHGASGFAANEFDFLIRERFSRRLPTILTSNVPLAKWADAYTPSMVSFVHEACIFVSFNGSDYRVDTFGGRA